MKILKRVLQVVLLVALAYGFYYAWRAFPIISGYAAKNMCSCVMLGGRNPEDVEQNELGRGFLSLASVTVDAQDSSATAKVFGLAKRKAIYRKGLGCTLVVGISEEELRSQKPRLPKPPALNPDTIMWPNGEVLPDTLPSGLDTDKINRALLHAFDEPGTEKLRRTRAVVIVYNGQLVAEKYAPGFNLKSRLIGWSMTKSITNAMVGILVRHGKLKVDAPAAVAAWKNDDRNKITLNDLMHMSSGLNWQENYAGPSGATNMLFKTKDAGIYAADAPLAHTPGTVFYYSSGTTNIISRIVRETLGDEAYYRFAAEELFYKTGMFSMVVEPDPGGTFVGSSFSFATARDWARFGLLYLNDGVWNGERILPEGWVKYTGTPTSGATLGEYGAQFWLNAGEPNKPANRSYPDVPADMLVASGYEGQNVFIIPSRKLVVVKLGLTQGNPVDDNKFLADLISALPK